AVSGQGESGSAQSFEVVFPEIEFLLEAQRPPLVAGARANVETLVKMLSELEGADPVRRAVQMRPAAFGAEIKESQARSASRTIVLVHRSNQAPWQRQARLLTRGFASLTLPNTRNDHRVHMPLHPIWSHA